MSLPIPPLKLAAEKKKTIFRINISTFFLIAFAILIAGAIFYYLIASNALSLLRQGELREGVVGQPRFLNPVLAEESEIDRTINRLVFRSLMRYDSPKKEFVGDIADKYSIENDGKTYHFYLKNNVYFHNGDKLTIDDVLFTYQVVQNENYHGIWKDAFANVKIEKINDTELTMTLENPLASFIEHNTLGIIPKSSFKDINDALRPDKVFNVSPIGSGNYKYIKKEFYAGTTDKVESLLLQSVNPKSSIHKIRFQFYDSEDKLLTAYKMGEIDSFGTLNPDFKENLKDWHNYALLTLPLDRRYYGLFFNLKSDKKINDPSIREALNYGLNKETLLKNTFKDEKIIMMEGPLESSSWAYDPEVKKYSYDEAKAKELLKNIKAEDLTFTLTYPTTAANEDLAKTLQNQWRAIDVTLNLNPISIYDLRDKVIGPRNFEILLLGQETSIDPDRYAFWHSTQVNYPDLNITGLKDRFIDRTLENGRKLTDQNKRKDEYQNFQKYFQNELPAITLYQPNFYYFVSKRFDKKMTVTTLGIPEDRFDNLLQNQ